MITKFKSIKKLAVFKNFEWDKSVKEENGSIKEFKDINIIYGRNYSGKTTLSRIIRALEVNKLSEKFKNPDFIVSIKGESDVNNTNLTNHSKKIRVFNEDFVRENLKFIIDPHANIEPFAILGDDNNKIEEEIHKLENELGSKEEDKETGLYKILQDAEKKYQAENVSFVAAEKRLNDQLNTKATGDKTSIKYNSSKYGNQNYNIRELKKDINIVLQKDFKGITNEEQKKLVNLLDEKTLKQIPILEPIILRLSEFIDEMNELVERPVSESGKIEELVKDAMLNKWVKEGRKYHKNKRDNCGFCGNPITENRWELLERHFDKESEKLEKSIDDLLEKIKLEKQSIKVAFMPNKSFFYSHFHSEIDALIDTYEELSKTYTSYLELVRKQLQKRKDDLINPFQAEVSNNNSDKVLLVWTDFENIRVKSNDFTRVLNDKKADAQKDLRLREVSDFLTTIKFTEHKNEIDKLGKLANITKGEKEAVDKKIATKLELIASKKRELNDEEKGAKKVNEYLNDFFEHGSLSLRAIEDELDEQKKIRFYVFRGKEKAFNLSEGECSLLAFCYFMAKLKDIETNESKPIIWIDDPISSLDGNHIFFVFSLLKEEIVIKKEFEQLFISTHNLDFLKYLKRINFNNSTYESGYFIINRIDDYSLIQSMPKYLQNYFTEFNFLFEQVYNCSNIDIVDDSNYTIFYNFGNNARKFLEIYLYYKYPDNTDQLDKLKKFFGTDSLPAILTDRINNEYSHLKGSFERGSIPIEVPEMKKAADLIIKRLKIDIDQFNSLLKSIGVELENIEEKK
jgi:wobble nucleotide-excising tRNase